MYDPKILELLKQAPPKNYVGGVGRGETGLTTRSDIGPASRGGDSEQANANSYDIDENDAGSRRLFNDRDQEDEEAGLFQEEEVDEEDEEADLIFAQIDRYMDERRKKRREEKIAANVKELRKERPKIQQQFADLKRQLSTVSTEAWEAIPDIGDMSRKKRDKRPEKFTPVPDSLLASAQWQSDYHSSIASDGTTSQALLNGQMTDLQMFSATRGAMLSHRLDSAGKEESVANGFTSMDPKGYLTSLSTLHVPSFADIGDLKKARQLMKSILQSDPSRPEAWMSAARLEEYSGRLVEARQLIAKGCEACPASDDVWLEAVRLALPSEQTEVLARAVRSRPQSVKVWLKAAELESDPVKRRQVLQHALARVPQSVQLWKVAVEGEERAEDARELLARAVECVPESVDVWLALAGLESYEKARAVLNTARRHCPNSHEIWLAAAKLEEVAGHFDNVPMILEKALLKLTERGVVVTRDTWMNEAQMAEAHGNSVTAQAIVQSIISLGIDEQDRLVTWRDDAQRFLSQKAIHCARAVYAHALSCFPSKKSIWLAAVDLERSHGTAQQLEDLLKRAVNYCPQLETLWLVGAKEKWKAGDVASARQILQEAFMANPNSEHIVLAAVKLESETGEIERARLLLSKARGHVMSARVWLKSVVFERVQGNLVLAVALADEGIQRFPLESKLYMIRGQLAEQQKDMDMARRVYAEGLKQCAESVPLYLLAARLEETTENLIRARALLERGRAKTKSTQLWRASILLEARHGNRSEAQSLLARALQLCPQSGEIWSCAIFLEAAPLRRARSLEALKQCAADPYVVVAVARMFWEQRALDKARSWFERGVTLQPDLGDHWAWYYFFETQHGNVDQAEAIIQRCVLAEPHHGEHWQAMAKTPDHARWTSREILMTVAHQLQQEKTTL